MNSKIKIGWSEIDITPKEKIRLAGQFYERISDEVETPISVTALAHRNDFCIDEEGMKYAITALCNYILNI